MPLQIRLGFGLKELQTANLESKAPKIRAASYVRATRCIGKLATIHECKLISHALDYRARVKTQMPTGAQTSTSNSRLPSQLEEATQRQFAGRKTAKKFFFSSTPLQKAAIASKAPSMGSTLPRSRAAHLKGLLQELSKQRGMCQTQRFEQASVVWEERRCARLMKLSPTCTQQH